MKSVYRILCAALGVLGFCLWIVIGTGKMPKQKTITYSQWLAQAYKIAQKENLMPLDDDKWLYNAYASGESPEFALREWPKEWR